MSDLLPLMFDTVLKRTTNSEEPQVIALIDMTLPKTPYREEHVTIPPISHLRDQHAMTPRTPRHREKGGMILRTCRPREKAVMTPQTLCHREEHVMIHQTSHHHDEHATIPQTFRLQDHRHEADSLTLPHLRPHGRHQRIPLQGAQTETKVNILIKMHFIA